MRVKVSDTKILILLFQLLVAVVLLLTMLSILYRKEKENTKQTLFQKYGIEHIFKDERDPYDVYGQSAINQHYMHLRAPLPYMQQQPGAGGQIMQQMQYMQQQQQGPPAPNVQQQPEVAKESAAGNDAMVQKSPEFEIVPSAKNVTPHDARLLVYNRVPKCGSTTVLDILNLTARMNQYWYRHSLLYNEMNLTSGQQRMVLTHLGVQNWEIPISYDRHMYYVDFAKEGNSRVAWMNIIRDPVERIISEFYFIRVKSRWDTIESLKKISHRKPPDSWFEMTLDECVPAKHPECYPKLGQYMRMQLTFLCGTDPVCSQVGNRKALQLAKMHVERQYSVVGTLEEFPLTLRVLEAYLPRFFRGVTSLEHSSGNVKKNVGEYKPSVSEETKTILRALLKEDVELYEFVRQRLFLQAEAIAKTER
ncbi:heparan sulfate 2-O-sulfotransferase 1-like [Penaeus chinensis]|uniref:heparan sulfate 2-O-sulfotransferase 1-like n=1 Tax=Penaeus chinensis TaxID=139456 RepID=UPI001FB5EEA7|nr:heparan sulfate 2-O-sulfotransferase 1-like [Penaeus chinensis]XP_047480304.1 heparan sulfate 2-O-sulfotransferase 1-like [Penaeus chinensis]